MPGGRKPARDAMPVSEQLALMHKEREEGLAVGRGQSVYKRNGKPYEETPLKQLITMSIEQAAEFATKEKVSLSNTEEVKKRTIIYLKCCQETGTFPSNQGLSRALGHTDRSLRCWRSRNGDTPTGQWLEMFSEMCAEILHQSALTGNAQPIITIFLSKANYDMREENYITLKNGAEAYRGEHIYNPAEIRERLGLPTTEDEKYE